MLVDNLLHERKADAQAAARTIAPCVRAPEPREDHFHFFRRQADARVLHHDGRHQVARCHAHGDRAAFRRVPYRVRDKVCRRLAKHVGVSEHHDLGLALVGQRQAGVRNERFVRCNDALHKFADIQQVFLHRLAAAFQARQAQERFDQASEALDFGVHRFQALCVRFEHAVDHGLDRRLDGHERRAQFVRHVRGKATLQLAVFFD